MAGTWRLGFALIFTACGTTGTAQPVPSAKLEGATTCERYASLAKAKGCAEPTSCSVLASCEPEGIRFVDCAATDLEQCLCESDGDLNCEGAWKPNEGPARCIDEQQALAACDPS